MITVIEDSGDGSFGFTQYIFIDHHEVHPGRTHILLRTCIDDIEFVEIQR